MRRRTGIVALVGLALAVELGLALFASHHQAADSGASEAAAAPGHGLAAGSPLDKPVGKVPLVDEHGRPTSLAAFRGRWLVIAPSLTLCHEVCPLTTGALMRLKGMLRRAGLQDRVTVAEATVDPWRDSPARVRAFLARTGSDVRFLTGSRAQIRRLWRVFGVFYERVPQDEPPDVDWWTGKPERFDVQHTDGVFIVDPQGHWRVAISGMPDVGHLPRRLTSLLNDEGEKNLHRPDTPWSAQQILSDLAQLMGRPVPKVAAPSPATGAADATAPAALAALRAQHNRLLGGGAAALRARLSVLRGHPVVVNEWASWCPPCREELPLLAAAAKRYGNRVAFLGLNVNDAASGARRLLSEHPVPYPSYIDADGSAARSLGRAQGLPTTVYLDAKGHVTFVHLGQYRDAASLASDIDSHALERDG